jgi:hypothetical protein
MPGIFAVRLRIPDPRGACSLAAARRTQPA